MSQLSRQSVYKDKGEYATEYFSGDIFKFALYALDIET